MNYMSREGFEPPTANYRPILLQRITITIRIICPKNTGWVAVPAIGSKGARGLAVEQFKAHKIFIRLIIPSPPFKREGLALRIHPLRGGACIIP